MSRTPIFPRADSRLLHPPPPPPPGEGRVHQCLRFNKEKISERCRNEEMKLAAIEYRDIRLRPKLNKQCSEEKAVYCKVSEEPLERRG